MEQQNRRSEVMCSRNRRTTSLHWKALLSGLLVAEFVALLRLDLRATGAYEDLRAEQNTLIGITALARGGSAPESGAAPRLPPPRRPPWRTRTSRRGVAEGAEPRELKREHGAYGGCEGQLAESRTNRLPRGCPSTISSGLLIARPRPSRGARSALSRRRSSPRARRSPPLPSPG